MTLVEFTCDNAARLLIPSRLATSIRYRKKFPTTVLLTYGLGFAAEVVGDVRGVMFALRWTKTAVEFETVDGDRLIIPRHVIASVRFYSGELDVSMVAYGHSYTAQVKGEQDEIIAKLNGLDS